MTTMHEASFTWPYADAHDVVLTGTFDKWSRSVHMSRSAAGGYESRVRVPWGEKVAYKFVVDGRWATDDRQPTEWDGAGNLNNVYVAPLLAPVVLEEKEVQASPAPVPTTPTEAEYSTPRCGASDAGVAVAEEETAEAEAEDEDEVLEMPGGLSPDTPIVVEDPETVSEAVEEEAAVVAPEETTSAAQEATAAVAPTAPIAIVPLLPTEQPPAYAREAAPADAESSPPAEVVAAADPAQIPAVDEVVPAVPAKEEASTHMPLPPAERIAGRSNSAPADAAAPAAPEAPPPSEKKQEDTPLASSSKEKLASPSGEEQQQPANPTTDEKKPTSLSAPSSPALPKTDKHRRFASMRLSLPRHKRQASLAASQTSEDGTLSTAGSSGADNSPPGSRFSTISASAKRRSLLDKIKDAFSDKDRKEQKARARREASMS